MAIANKTPQIVKCKQGKPETAPESSLKEPDMLLAAMPVYNPKGLLQGKSGIKSDMSKK